MYKYTFNQNIWNFREINRNIIQPNVLNTVLFFHILCVWENIRYRTNIDGYRQYLYLLYKFDFMIL